MNPFVFFFRPFVWLFSVISFVILISQSWSTEDIFKPERLDSLYIVNSFPTENDSLLPIESRIYFNPGDAGLIYREIISGPPDSAMHSWLIESKSSFNGITLILLHDLTESKLQYIDFAKAFSERGFRVLLTDLRAHGSSSGDFFHPGQAAVWDLKVLVDSVYNLPATINVSIMGMGVSAQTAVSFALQDQRPGVFILENPYLSMRKFLSFYSNEKWGTFSKLYEAVAIRNLESKLQFDSREMQMTQLLDSLKKPVMFVSVGNLPELPSEDVFTLFRKSGSKKKEIFKVAGPEIQSEEDTEKYFNRIAIFMLRNSATPFKNSRFKKLASL